MTNDSTRRSKRSGELTSITSLLDRYRERLRPPQASVEKVVVAVIQEEIGISLRPEQVSYTVATKTLVLRVPSVLKTELLTKRQTILSVTKQRLGRHNAPETLL